ncbi:helix-turn-helix transcriptional regulator [Pedobacter hiemivivus]|uniref:helix-turn-helix transcriptional regulator n=1 Tax=Pedobacter hiemivivus TaxID=2530454 RepID=UPI00197FED57|nr:helix-turn-helix transcriptional regulator [Pedobacter hiemivivus]
MDASPKLNKIKAVLAERNVTGWMLAIFLNVSEQTVSSWCQNSSQPNRVYFNKIADFLNVDQRDLIVSTPPGKNKLAEVLREEHKKFLAEGKGTYVNEESIGGKKSKKILNPELVKRLRDLVEKSEK